MHTRRPIVYGRARGYECISELPPAGPPHLPPGFGKSRNFPGSCFCNLAASTSPSTLIVNGAAPTPSPALARAPGRLPLWGNWVNALPPMASAP